MTHTPGPWISNVDRWKKYSSEPNRYLCIFQDRQDGRSVNVATVHGLGMEAGDDAQEANARLIAAAPDLLDALKLAEQTIQGELTACGYKTHECTDVWGKSTQDLVAALVPIRAAIDEAEGRKPTHS